MEFDWSVRTIGEWRRILAQASKTNWMQTWPYAEAMFKRDKKPSKLALIRQDGTDLGLMCIQIIEAGPLRFIELKRGPIWFCPNPSQQLLIEFAEELRKHFPRSLLQRFHWMPEETVEPTTIKNLERLGFQLRSESFETIWLDLRQTESELKRQLKQKWRNCLSKSLQAPLEIQLDHSSKRIDLFLNYYFIHKSLKKYVGPSQAFLKEELESSFKAHDAFLVWAVHDHHAVAGMAFIQHGNSASYRVGWNTSQGRLFNSHYALIWRAIQNLKEKGTSYLDLGGLVSEGNSGVNHFKEGLGGQKHRFFTFKG